jgi:hypothetical protein
VTRLRVSFIGLNRKEEQFEEKRIKVIESSGKTPHAGLTSTAFG